MPADIQQAMEEINGIFQAQRKTKQFIKFNRSDYRWFMQSKEEFQQIATSKQCNLYINKEQFEISGNQKSIDECIPIIKQKIDSIKQNFMQELISNPQMCIVLEGMKKDPNFEKEYKVHVKRVGNQDSNQQISQEPLM